MSTEKVQGKAIPRPSWHLCRGHFFLLLGILLPVVINFLILRLFVEPCKKEVAHMRSFSELVTLEPRLEALIAESNELMAQRVEKGLPSNDPGVVLEEIRALAKIHKVEIKELRIQNAEMAVGAVSDKALSAAGFQRFSLSMEIRGRYAKIARWLASLDQRMEVRLDNFTLLPSQDGFCELQLRLKLLLRKT